MPAPRTDSGKPRRRKPTVQRTPARTFRRSYLWALLITAAIAAWFMSGDIIVGGQGEARQPPAAADTAQEPVEKLFRVRVRTVTAEPREAVLVVRGRTEADARIEVKAETAGIVEELPVEKGRRVGKGDLLCLLETGARLAAVHEAEARLAKAEADYEASRQLAERGHGAKLKVAADKANLDAAKAALERARLELARTRIVAPFAGLVEDLPAKVGSYLTVAGTCAKLVALDPLLVVGSVSEREVGHLKVGLNGSAALVTGELTQGRLRYIAPAAEPTTRTFRVELEVPNPGGAMRDGVTADIRIPLEEQTAHRLPPAVLTLNDAGQIGVRIVEQGDTVRFVPVTLLGEADDGVWVAGLPPVVDVITVGQEYVVDGQKVEAVNQAGVAAR